MLINCMQRTELKISKNLIRIRRANRNENANFKAFFTLKYLTVLTRSSKVASSSQMNKVAAIKTRLKHHWETISFAIVSPGWSCKESENGSVKCNRTTFKFFYLESTDCPHVIDTFFNSLVHRKALVSPCDQDDDFLRVHYSCNANRQRLFWDCAEIIVEKTRVRFQSILR